MEEWFRKIDCEVKNNMPELTEKQKEDLKNWEKNLRISFAAIMGWIFVVTPTSLLLLSKIFKVTSTPNIKIVSFINALIIITLWVMGMRMRYKKCPSCHCLIKGFFNLISLPDKCDRCGVKFK